MIYNSTAAAAVQRELIATDNGSTLTYIEGESDNTTWPGMRSACHSTTVHTVIVNICDPMLMHACTDVAISVLRSYNGSGLNLNAL